MSFHFLVLDGVGVSINTPGNIFLHLPSQLDIEPLFHKPGREFTGNIYPSRSIIRIKKFKPDQNVRVFDHFTHSYSPSKKILAVFTTENISQVEKPSIFRDWLAGNRINVYHEITSPTESPTYSRIIWSLFDESMATNRWEVTSEQVVARLGYPNLLAVEIWLKDLVSANLIAHNKETLVVLDPLIYMMMHTINSYNSQEKPAFIY